MWLVNSTHIEKLGSSHIYGTSNHGGHGTASVIWPYAAKLLINWSTLVLRFRPPTKILQSSKLPFLRRRLGATMGHRSHHVQVNKSRSTPNTPNSRPFSVAPSLRGVKTSWSRCRWFFNFFKVGKMTNPFSGSILPYLALSFCIRFWPGLAEKVNGGSVGVGAGAGLLDAKVGIAIFTSGLASKNDQKWWVSTVSTSKNSHPDIIRIITQHSPQTKFCAKVFMLWGAVGSTYEGARKIPKTVRVTKPSPMASSKS